MTIRNLRSTILTADLIWGVLAMPIAYLMRYGWVWHGPTDSSALIFIPPLMAALLLWSLMSSWVRLDGFQAAWTFRAAVAQLLLATLVLMAGLFATAYLVRQFISRLALGYFGLLLFFGFLIIRLAARSVLASRRTRGLVRNVVIVGNGQLAREMAGKIESHPELLRRVVGFLRPGEDTSQNSSRAAQHALTLPSHDVAELFNAQGVDEIILAVPTPSHPEIVDLTSRCSRLGIAVSMVPQPYELYLTRPALSDLDGLPLLHLVSVADHEPAWKRSFDMVVTLALLPVCIPPMLIAAAFLKVKNGKAFCKETRCGYHGNEFQIYRLNSPRRATRLPSYERLLQSLSVTELPQVFNVLRGDMSLVGPRPEGLDRARHYTDWHRQRLNAKPGITGLAQVYGLRDQHSSEDKTRYDLQYILHRSVFQDISLLLQTAWTLMVRLVHPQRTAGSADWLTMGKSDETYDETLVPVQRPQPSTDLVSAIVSDPQLIRQIEERTL
jgi:lipopolysaccharide/colanic/teichoic acid biosynthesis glycosyltransferase